MLHGTAPGPTCGLCQFPRTCGRCSPAVSRASDYGQALAVWYRRMLRAVARVGLVSGIRRRKTSPPSRLQCEDAALDSILQCTKKKKCDVIIVIVSVWETKSIPKEGLKWKLNKNKCALFCTPEKLVSKVSGKITVPNINMCIYINLLCPVVPNPWPMFALVWDVCDLHGHCVALNADNPVHCA